MKKLPSITVVIATYNAALTIASAVRSVLLQDYPHLELLVIDGASTDETVALLRDFDDSRLRVISEPDNGIYDAWNKGVRMSTAERILFIGADDELNGKSAISNFWNHVSDENASVELLFGNLIAYGPHGIVAGIVGAKWRDPWEFAGRHLWCNFQMPIMATFFERNAIILAGYFDPRLKIMADINLVLSIARSSRPLYVPGEPITLMGFGGVSTRPESGAVAMREAINIRRKHDLGVFTNVEFVARSALWQFKYLIGKYIGQDAAIKTISILQRVKRMFFFKVTK